MSNLGLYGPTECILSQEHLEHIAVCHPKFGPMIARQGIRWYADDTVLQDHYSHITVPCRGKCNIQRAIRYFGGVVPEIPSMQVLNLGLERFQMTMMLGECPVCRVIHAARSLPS